ncbi:hypothetical protein SERLA73DRAFT_158662 [Serpula lacrymans var. lacrymans S7.3]|uniref:Carbonic anhydrase n=2 Tax=Serpula lacrymans var. lacrymans TaxID=341189 RepID=F8PN08_SERL3|nr:uncharacterized protein SERLADRAFT_413475 [Serpula lacrymans var. lacrymans S7.9]EGO02990.1 hypothetical protein SERLA73DRAFT_158662 [Serpula lacrymans var. lacrymans S7.3]EGO28671.1 hypothetical protein SERLADRAFT_413475 [Serpula lacrymans var. lacrymans S7.9]
MASKPPAILARLLSGNEEWARTLKSAAGAGFFKGEAEGQWPKILWIGCSDSRVPESVITSSMPGDVFATRNIANQAHIDDDSFLSVLYYAVKHVGVEHVIVVGHTHCGGAEAGYAAAQKAINTGSSVPPPVIDTLPPDAHINKWLAPLSELAMPIAALALETEDALRMLVEENVRTQVHLVSQTETILEAWDQPPQARHVFVHGWVYDVEHGRLRDLNISRGTRETNYHPAYF